MEVLMKSLWLIYENPKLNLIPTAITVGSFGILPLYSHVVVVTTLERYCEMLMPSCQNLVMGLLL